MRSNEMAQTGSESESLNLTSVRAFANIRLFRRTLMRIISKRRLREFWDQHPDATHPLLHWYRTARKASWKNLVDVRRDFRHADSVGACTVFNIGGNKFRLIAAVKYDRQTIYVLRIMTHKEYDTEDWLHDCQCQ